MLTGFSPVWQVLEPLFGSQPSCIGLHFIGAVCDALEVLQSHRKESGRSQLELIGFTDGCVSLTYEP